MVLTPFHGYKNVMNVQQGQLAKWEIDGKQYMPEEFQLSLPINKDMTRVEVLQQMIALEDKAVAQVNGDKETAYVTHRGDWSIIPDGDTGNSVAFLTVSALVKASCPC